MSNTKDLTIGNPGKVMLAFSLPIFLGNMFQQLYSTVDSIIVGQFVGAYSLGAVGTTFPITFMIVAVATGLANGAAVLIGQNYGAGKIHSLRRIINVCVRYSVVISAIMTVICYSCAPLFIKIIKASPEIYDDALTYIKVYFIGLVFTFSYNMMSSVFRALGDSKTPLIFLVISSIINIVLDLYFILVYGWGVFGAALATVIAQGVSFVLQMIFLVKRMKHLSAAENEGEALPDDFDKQTLKALMGLAIPSTTQEMTIGLSIFISQALINRFGADASSAYTACGKIENFAMMPMISMTIATTVFTAQNMGAGKSERAQQGFKYSLGINLAIGAVVALLILIFPKQLMRIFIPADTQAAVFEIGMQYLRFMAVYIFLMAVLFSCEGLLRGSGDMKIMIVFAIASTSTKIIASLVLINFWGISGLFMGSVCSWGIEALLSIVRVRSGKWKKATLA